MDIQEMHTLFADYPTRQAADQAIGRLQTQGYTMDDISVITKDNQDISTTPAGNSPAVDAAEGAGTGAVTGGVVGGVAGLLAGIGVAPVIAGLLIGGPVAAALGLAGAAALTVSGAATGALAGGLIGALTKLGLSNEDAGYYNDIVENGGIVLGVPVTHQNENMVRTLLEGTPQRQSTGRVMDVDNTLK